LPATWLQSDQVFSIDVFNFQVEVNAPNPCEPLTFAIDKYKELFFPGATPETFPDFGNIVLSQLFVRIIEDSDSSYCLDYPRLATEEDTYEHCKLLCVYFSCRSYCDYPNELKKRVYR